MPNPAPSPSPLSNCEGVCPARECCKLAQQIKMRNTLLPPLWWSLLCALCCVLNPNTTEPRIFSHWCSPHSLAPTHHLPARGGYDESSPRPMGYYGVSLLGIACFMGLIEAGAHSEHHAFLYARRYCEPFLRTFFLQTQCICTFRRIALSGVSSLVNELLHLFRVFTNYGSFRYFHLE